MTLDFDYLFMFFLAVAVTIVSGLFPEPYRKIRNAGWIACYSVAAYLVWEKGFENWNEYAGPWIFMSAFSGLVYFLYEYNCVKKGSQRVSVVSIQKIIDCLYLWPVLLPEAVEFWMKENEKNRPYHKKR